MNSHRMSSTGLLPHFGPSAPAMTISPPTAPSPAGRKLRRRWRCAPKSLSSASSVDIGSAELAAKRHWMDDLDRKAPMMGAEVGMTIMLKFKSDVAKRRLWTRKVTAIGLAFFLSTPLVAAADREMTQEYSTCLEKSNGVTIEMINCILAETIRQDARLNENYKRLISKLATARKKALVEAQRAWIRFRDANCGFYADPEGGSAARVTAHECLLNATVDRAKELRLLANDQ